MESAQALSTYATYIAPRKMGTQLADVCNPNESTRTVIELIVPYAVTDDSDTAFAAGTVFSNDGVTAGVVDDTSRVGRKKCDGVGASNSWYFAGGQDEDDSGALEQVQLGTGGFNADSAIPEGLWKLKIGGEDKANFDLSVTYPNDADGHSHIFMPMISYDVDATTKVISNWKMKWAVWNAASREYKTLTDLEIARANIEAIGLSITDSVDNNLQGRILFNPEEDYNQGDEGWTIADVDGVISLPAPLNSQTGAAQIWTSEGGSANLGKIFLYYRAAGNSYNFQIGN